LEDPDNNIKIHNIKMDLKRNREGAVGWIHLVQNRD
jgi:hypothetical protein